MKSGKSNRKLTAGDVCVEYFRSQVFPSAAHEETSPAYFFANASMWLEATDASFRGTQLDVFLKEMVAANMELFGLAWLNHNYEISKELSVQDSALCEEITFTKRYLQDTGKGDIWKRMGFYNDAMAQTVAEGVVSEDWGRLRDIPRAVKDEDYEELKEKQLIEMTKDLVGLFSKYTGDSECSDRLVFRSLVVPTDAERITVLSQKFSLVLMERLKRDLRQTGLFALQRVVVGLYSNAVNYLDAVREYGSYEAAKDARRVMLEGLRKVARGLQQNE